MKPEQRSLFPKPKRELVKRLEPPITNTDWPKIIAGDPARYPGLMQQLAIRALHRAAESQATYARKGSNE